MQFMLSECKIGGSSRQKCRGQYPLNIWNAEGGRIEARSGMVTPLQQTRGSEESSYSPPTGSGAEHILKATERFFAPIPLL